MITVSPLQADRISQYPQLIPTAQKKSLLSDISRKELIAGIAEFLGQPVGLIVGWHDQEKSCSTIETMYVLPKFHKLDLEKQLLQYVEQVAKARSSRRLAIQYIKSGDGSDKLRDVLWKAGWEKPIIVHEHHRIHAGALANQPWVRATRLRRTDEIKTFTELSSAERDDIIRGCNDWYPEYFYPWKQRGEVHPATSLFLYCHGQVAGWTHTVVHSESELFYNTLFIRKEWRAAGKGATLLAAAIRAQHQSGIPYARYIVDINNLEMTRLIGKRFERFFMSKQLAWNSRKML